MPEESNPMRAPPQPRLRPLLDRRLVVVSCKGGTGNTTVAASLALAGAHRGLRVAIIETCRRNGLRMARPARSDVHLRLAVEEIEARQEEQFGTTFVLRTYAVEAEDIRGARFASVVLVAWSTNEDGIP